MLDNYLYICGTLNIDDCSGVSGKISYLRNSCIGGSLNEKNLTGEIIDVNYIGHTTCIDGTDPIVIISVKLKNLQK